MPIGEVCITRALSDRRRQVRLRLRESYFQNMDSCGPFQEPAAPGGRLRCQEMVVTATRNYGISYVLALGRQLGDNLGLKPFGLILGLHSVPIGNKLIQRVGHCAGGAAECLTNRAGAELLTGVLGEVVLD